MKRFLFLSKPALILHFAATAALAQSDDFNDGNINGWTCFDPIGMALQTPFASCPVVNGAVVMTCPASPAPAQVGPARAGALRPELYSDFCVVVDFLAWDQSNPELAFGLLARIQANPGPGAVHGYGFTYQVDQQNLQIVRINSENPTTLATTTVTLDSQADYRFVFTGHDDVLTGMVFALPNLLTPMQTVTFTDTSFAGGMCGMVIFDQTAANAAQRSAGATFDNYSATDGSPPAMEISANAGDLEVYLNWPSNALCYRLQSSTNLTNWQDSLLNPFEFNGRLMVTDSLNPTGQRFYRLKLRQ